MALLKNFTIKIIIIEVIKGGPNYGIITIMHK